MELLHRLKLETGDFQHHILIGCDRPRLRLHRGQGRLAGGYPEIPPDEGALSALLQKLADQRHRRALPVGPGHGHHRRRQKAGRQFQLPDDPDPPGPHPIERIQLSRHTRADHDKISPFECGLVLHPHLHRDARPVHLRQDGGQFLRLLPVGQGDPGPEMVQQACRTHSASG
jgi:hypothetical protein